METGINLSQYIGQPAMLEQAAEEAIEFAHACLKLAREMRGVNKVHGHTHEELVEHLQEEAADNYICMDQLFKTTLLNHEDVSYWIVKKNRRMKERIENETNED